MKIKFSDFGRCLVCLMNPCDCKASEPMAEHQSWRDRFESLFDSFIEDNPNGGFHYDVDKKKVEKFIENEIATERERVMARVCIEIKKVVIQPSANRIINLIRAKL